MEVIVNNLAATTYVGIASDGDAVHRVYCASAHRNSFVDYNVSTILSHDDTSLRKTYHITKGMGKDIYSLTPPPGCPKSPQFRARSAFCDALKGGEITG